MQGGCKVYMDSYTALNGSCFMVTWTVLKNHLLEVGLTQNWETMALRTLTTTTLSYFIMCEDPAWIEIQWYSIWLRAGHVWLHTTLEGPWPHYIISEVSWDGLWTLSFGLSQFHGHSSWLVCVKQSPTLGAHTHAHDHGFWMGMSVILLCMGGHGWT